jgi:hypothetical protein
MRLHLRGVLAAESEAKTGTAPASARREERLEDPIADFKRDAGAVVAHRNDGGLVRAVKMKSNPRRGELPGGVRSIR